MGIIPLAFFIEVIFLKFKVKNEFIHKGKRVYPGDVIDVKSGKVSELKKMNVLAEPVKKAKRTATRKPKETRKSR